MDKKEFITTITMTSMFIVWVPIYVYLLIKWCKHQHHFVIRNRFPNISITVFIVSIFVQILAIIDSLIPVYSWEFHLIICSLTAVTTGLIFYRIHLIYVRWTINMQYLQTITKSDLVAPKHIHHSLMSRVIFLTIVVLLPVMLLLLSLFPAQSTVIIAMVYLIQMLIGIFLAIRTLKSNASESLDCIKESVLSIACILTMSFLPPTLNNIVPEYIDCYRIGGSLCSALLACCSLYIGIHLIHKVEKSKNPRIEEYLPPVIRMHSGINCSTSACMTRVQSTSSVTPMTPPTLSVSMVSHSVAESIQIPSRKSSPGPQTPVDKMGLSVSVLDQPLTDFLQTRTHYQLFAGYLSECFALENLMFLERAIILYHVILSSQECDSQFKNQTAADKGRFVGNKLYSLEFDYLPQMYEDIESIIQEEVGLNTDKDPMIYKRGIIKVIKLIYSTCCDTKLSDTPINTSYAVQCNLQTLLESKEGQTLLDAFESYEDLLKVFHDAIVEIWDVCECVYDFNSNHIVKDRLNNI
eukprot:329498_1